MKKNSAYKKILRMKEDLNNPLYTESIHNYLKLYVKMFSISENETRHIEKIFKDSIQ